jgi:hypothetical protein
MPFVEHRHAEYVESAPDWEKVRDVIAGERAVKEKGTQYLPRLGGFDGQEYGAYKQRALFFEATPRTVSGLVGAIFRKVPVVEIDEKHRRFIDDMTMTATPFSVFTKDITTEVLSMGRVGVLVDVPPVEGLRPYARTYMAEDITNWRVEVIDGIPTLVAVVLREGRESLDEDGRSETREMRRELLLTVDGYVQRLWTRAEGRGGAEGDWFVIETYEPVRQGQRLEQIPFVFVGPTTLDPDVERSPIMGLVNVNLSHYVTSADLEHGAHFTALPTPWVSGVTEDIGSLKIGPSQAWTLPEGAQAGMLEYHGTGLDALEKRLERKEHAMAVLGARLLEDQKKAAEAADTLRQRSRGENSVLGGIADTVGRGLSRVLDWMIWWDGSNDDTAVVSLNKEFTDTGLDAAQITALIRGWQAGAYPREIVWRTLRQSDVVPPDMSDEAIADALDAEPPLGLSG